MSAINCTVANVDYFLSDIWENGIGFKLPFLIKSNETQGVQSHKIEQDFSEVKIKKLITISKLKTINLKNNIEVTIENDDDGFLALSVDLPLYGYGDYPNEAIENLKEEIESCYFDLLEDDNYSEEWLNYKRFLKALIE
jgi:hypothetical protein